MLNKLFLLTFLLVVAFWVNLVNAAQSPPTSLIPVNSATTTSSRIEWQSPTYSLTPSGNPYRIQVHSSPDFSPPLKKDTYTDNTYYTPSLSPGIWYWRVMAKSLDTSWSDWSEIWSFTLTDSTSTPTPTPTPSSSPTPSPTPTSSPSSSTIFIVSTNSTTLKTNESLSLTIELSLPQSANQSYFIKPAFYKSGKSNYFGYSYVGSEWIKNSISYINQFKITLDSNGLWKGNLKTMPDSEDSGFEGDGDYQLKVGRYTTSGSGPTWSNDLKVTLAKYTSPSPLQSFSPTPSIKHSPSSPSATSSNSSISTPSPSFENSISTVSGVFYSASPSEIPTKVATFQFNYYFLVAGLLLFTASAVFVYFKKRV